LAPVHDFKPLPLDLIVGIERQKADLIENSRRHASGAAAHDVLLWGARGMGKSALVKSVVAAL
jgi:predicted AAA+ superfamily ATPase